MTKKTYTPRAPAPLARTVLLWVWIQMGATAVSMISGVVLFAAASAEAGPSLDTVQTVDVMINLAYVAVFAVGSVLGLKWIHRVNMNAHVMAPDLTITPPWAIGWYFVPIATLFKPFKAMKETWQASCDPQDWRSVPTPGWMRVWWGFWIASSVIDQANSWVDPSGDLDLIRFGEVVGLVSGVLNLVACVYFAKLVRALTERQTNTQALEVF